MSEAARNATPKGGQHFRQFNALVDRHLRTTSTPILKAVLVALRHANPDGETFVTPDTVAMKTGMNLRNAQRAIAAATAEGLLPVVSEGGGRGRATVRRLALAETPAQCADVTGRKTPALGDAKPRRSKAQNPGAGDHKTPAQCAGPTAYSTAFSTANTNSRADAVAGEFEIEEAEKAQGFALLRHAGVSASVAENLASRLSSRIIGRIIAESRGGNLHNPAGLLVTKCKAEIQSGAIANELVLDDGRKLEAAERDRAEAQRRAELQKQETEAAMAWAVSLSDERVQEYRARMPAGVAWQDPRQSELFARSLYRQRNELDARIAAQKAVDAERQRKAAEEQARTAAEAALLAAWQSEHKADLAGLAERMFAREPAMKGLYEHCGGVDPATNPRLVAELKRAVDLGTLEVPR